jgi:hypothetical protein
VSKEKKTHVKSPAAHHNARRELMRIRGGSGKNIAKVIAAIDTARETMETMAPDALPLFDNLVEKHELRNEDQVKVAETMAVTLSLYPWAYGGLPHSFKDNIRMRQSRQQTQTHMAVREEFGL